MGDAAKVIDWNGTDMAEFAALPPGRYRVELVEAESDDGLVSSETEARIVAGRTSIAEGRGVSLAEADARWRATIEAARSR
jgi:hypothetical protein